MLPDSGLVLPGGGVAAMWWGGGREGGPARSIPSCKWSIRCSYYTLVNLSDNKMDCLAAQRFPSSAAEVSDGKLKC